MRNIRARILAFQQAILHRDVTVDGEHGSYLTQRYLPLRRVGVCVPGGAAAYPSTVLMTVVPAQAAGVEQIAVVAPPTPFGSYNRDLLATCHELGVTEVYRVGGAQGVAALAYGVDGLERVDKIVGPGNLFVALAKKFVFGDVGIDSIAGPSEVIVVASGQCRPDFVAADLIAQAEHAPGSAIFITWNRKLVDLVHEELDKQLATLERGDAARQSLESFGALVLVRDDAEAVELINDAGERTPPPRVPRKRDARPADSQRRRDFPGPVFARAAGRLRRRPVARTARPAPPRGSPAACRRTTSSARTA